MAGVSTVAVGTVLSARTEIVTRSLNLLSEGCWAIPATHPNTSKIIIAAGEKKEEKEDDEEHMLIFFFPICELPQQQKKENQNFVLLLKEYFFGSHTPPTPLSNN